MSIFDRGTAIEAKQTNKQTNTHASSVVLPGWQQLEVYGFVTCLLWILIL